MAGIDTTSTNTGESMPGATPIAPSGLRAGLGAIADQHILRSYLAIPYRRRWTALPVFLVVFGVFAVRTFTAIPVYEATARIVIEADNPSVVSFQDIVDTNRRASEYFQTQYRLLTSRSLAKLALQNSGLITHPVFRAAAAQNETDATDDVEATSGGAEGESDSRAEAAAIRRFQRSVTVAPVRNSRLVDVTFSSTDPTVAWRGANAAVTAFIQQAADTRSSATRDAASFLTQMLSEQRAAVADSEIALQRYREEGNAASAEDRQNIVAERLARLNEALTRARTERIQKETAFQRVSELDELSHIDAVPAVRDNPMVQRIQIELGELQRRKNDLGQQLTERHPEMLKVSAAIEQVEARLRAQVGQLVGSLRAEYESAMALEQAMTEALDKQRVEALAQNRRGIDLGVLQRDAETNRKLYDALLQRTKEAGITEQLKTNAARIVDTAEPPRGPVRPNRRRDLTVGFAAAMALALGLVFTLEMFDTRIKSPDDITRHLQLPTLAMVPVCTLGGDGEESATLIDGSTAQNFIEAFRSLRTSILFASAERGPKSLLVSSTAPSEGKTFVSCNLALSLAMARQRVLLIDADMRRPKVHTRFGCDRGPGLSDVLVGNVALADAARPSGRESLDILPAGTLPPNPPELLGSPQFTELMTQAMQTYDWVVLDSPPIRAVTDAAVIAHLATAVVFVTGAEMTDAKSAQVALERLTAAHGRIAGVVLNRVRLQRHKYYYAEYYSREDERYYRSPQSQA